MDINEAAMKVILNASQGRDKIDESVIHIKDKNFGEAERLLNEAEKYIVKAHKSQTSVIQTQSAGEDLEYSLLFIHAQDTLMTINTELRVTKNMLTIIKEI